MKQTLLICATLLWSPLTLSIEYEADKISVEERLTLLEMLVAALEEENDTLIELVGELTTWRATTDKRSEIMGEIALRLKQEQERASEERTRVILQVNEIAKKIYSNKGLASRQERIACVLWRDRELRSDMTALGLALACPEEHGGATPTSSNRQEN